MKTLYRLNTVGIGSFYVLATNSHQAEEVLLEELSKSDYGFYSKREIESIDVIAREIGKWDDSGKLNFPSGNRLILK